MPSDSKARDALLSIRDSVVLAQTFTEGLTLEAFTRSTLHFFATTRALEIISEAARRLPSGILARHPDLPWRSIMDAGNVYRHAYDQVAEAEVWRTVQGSLAPLLAAVTLEIEALSRD